MCHIFGTAFIRRKKFQIKFGFESFNQSLALALTPTLTTFREDKKGVLERYY